MDVFTNLILTYAAKKEYQAAMARCDRQFEQVDGSPEHLAVIYNLKGGLFLATHDMTQAQEAFQKAIESDPEYLKPYFALARIFLQNKQEDEAIAQYETVLSKNPQQAGPHMLLGTIYDMQRKFDLSEKHYRRALEISPDFAPAANNLAYLMASEGKNLDEALGFAQRAKEKLPDDPSIMDTLGWVYYQKGLYDSAIREFSDSLEKMPDNATLHYHLGLAYFKKDKKELAKAQLDKALQLNPKFDGAEDAQKLLSEL
jgi:tetratricopeptide (TPR) repeat protein